MAANPTQTPVSAAPGCPDSPEHERVDVRREISSRLRRVAFDNNLNAVGFRAMLGDVLCPPEQLETTIDEILVGDVPDDLETLRLIAAQVEVRYAITLGSERLITPQVRVGRRGADLIGVILGVFTMYLVFGGLLSGHSHLLGHVPGPVAAGAFLAVIATLAIVEALHVAATQVRLLDLSALADSHRRLARVHRRIRSEKGINAFLAGRQLLVVMTVFVLAPLTTMSTMTKWPFTAFTLPLVVKWAVDLGVPGAFATLYLGQLSPQFIATRRTIWLMNSPVAEAFVVLAGIVDAVGLARCGHWLASVLTARAGADPRIPLSPSLRWQQTADDEIGSALLGQVRRLRIAPDRVRVSVRQGLTVRGQQLNASSQAIAVAAPPVALATTSYLVRADGEHSVNLVTTEQPSQNDRLRLLRHVAVPRVGAFQPGDEVRVSLDADFDGQLGCDAALIESATRFVLWEIELEQPPSAFPPLTLTTYAIGSNGIDERTQVGEPVIVHPHRTGDGRAIVTHLVEFPTPQQLVVLAWEVAW